MTSMVDLLAAPARQAAALAETGHRPWPVRRDSWLMGQSWEDLLFAHWRVAPESLEPMLPAGLALDEHDGSAWLGITPFLISGLRLHGTLPLPRVSSFPELNVRTYVTAENKPGIWFFSLDTSSLLAVEAARRLYRLPYHHARMSLDRRGGRIEIGSSRREGNRPHVLEASYGPAGNGPFEPPEGSLEHFLTERYCLYAHGGGRLFRADIHHLPWQMREAWAEIELNTMPPDGIVLGDASPLCHLAERQDVVIWPLEEVGRGRPHRKRPAQEASIRLKQ
jgi:uncharacterized protein YqjF (DUF2071 family)